MEAYQRIAPNLPAGHPAASITVPPAPPQVILAALKGIVFVSGSSGLTEAGLPLTAAGASGIAAPALPLLDQPSFRTQIAPFIGRPLTLPALNRIARLALGWYRAHRQPFVDITIPPQNINTGVVQIVITEYRIGKIEVTGNHWFSAPPSGVPADLCQAVELGGLENDLDWLNQNPFRHVNAVFQPGAMPGITNVDLQTKDRLPLRVYAGYDNEGVTSLGRNKWNLGANWGNAFGLVSATRFRCHGAKSCSCSVLMNGKSLKWPMASVRPGTRNRPASAKSARCRICHGSSRISRSGTISRRPTAIWNLAASTFSRAPPRSISFC